MLNRLIKRLQQLTAKLNNFIKWGLSKSRLIGVIFAIARVESQIEQIKKQEGKQKKKEKRLPHPQNYKTQSGLLKALDRASEMAGDVSLMWWFENAKYALIHIWGWQEQDAAKYVAAYKPTISKYNATA